MGIGVYGGHADFGDNRRYWNFEVWVMEKLISKISFAHLMISVTKATVGRMGRQRMNREAGAIESCRFVKKVDFAPQCGIRQSHEKA